MPKWEGRKEEREGEGREEREGERWIMIYELGIGRSEETRAERNQLR